MASPQASDKVATKNKITVWDHDPGTTNALVCSPDGGTTLRYYDMKDYESFAVIAAPTVFNDDLTLLEIVAADDTLFTGGDVTVIKTSGAITADAIGDWAFLECTAEEVAQEGADAGYNLRYVAARLTFANGSDEALVTYIGVAKRQYDALTAATTIA